MADYNSRLPELCLLKDKTASYVITSMKSTYARRGIPDDVFGNNMPWPSVNFQVSGDSRSLHRAQDTLSQTGGVKEQFIPSRSYLERHVKMKMTLSLLSWDTKTRLSLD